MCYQVLSPRDTDPDHKVLELPTAGEQADLTSDLEVIVPAYNEAVRIGPTIDALSHHLDAMQISSTIRVIDNGSSDHTAEVVDAAVDQDQRTRVTVEGCARRGKGNAVRRGMVTAQSRWVGFCDADLATPAEAITPAVRHLQDGWPVVIGSRHIEGARLVQPQSLTRRAGGRGFRLLARHLGGTDTIADTQCGFKFFEGGVARHLFSEVTSSGFAFDVEVLARAQQRGYAIKELPVEWTDRDGSTFRPTKHFREVTGDLWRVRQTRRSEVRRAS
jgi:dolichyl-phosphate beta-glucosyltransferase